MKKIILTIMILTSALAFAKQAGLAHYKYTQGNYSYAVVDKDEFDALGTMCDREIAFMEYSGIIVGATPQAGFNEYRYTQNDLGDLVESDDMTRMARGRMIGNHVTGQPGYAEYKYTQGQGVLD